MRIIAPKTVAEADVTSSVAITETEWVPGTYATGTQRYVGTKLYEVVASPDTTDEPTAGAAAATPTWFEVGSINRFKMFDYVIGDATEQGAGDIDVTINASGSLVNGVAVFEVTGNTVQLIVTDAVEGEVYNRTINLKDYTGINNIYQYLFAPYVARTSAVFIDLPAYTDANIRVIVSADGGDTAVGEMVIGTLHTIGTTMMNFEFSIEDFSRKERDEFGRFTILERRFAKLSNYDVFLQGGQISSSASILSKLRAMPAVYIGDPNRSETVTLGFYRDFRSLRRSSDHAEMTLEVDGLV